jgi:hypothetical protein
MNAPLWRRASCWLAIVLGGASAAAPTPGSVAWIELTPGCPVAPGSVTGGAGEQPRVVACGGAGSFVFGKPGLRYSGDCPTVDGGTEIPPRIPVEPPPRSLESFPCSGGSCLGRSPGRPWVAILDWPTAHGWSVGATVREASDQRVDVELYDLTAAGSLGQWVPSVSDLHVLVQLCALEEAVRAHPGDRPLAVNMSFGRRVEGTGCAASGPSLGCSVSRVLSHLAVEEGIFAVAAAGNHHELLFPASSPGVISAGALDLTYLQQARTVRASTQTPLAAEALMLGYGIYLSAPSTADGGDGYWPAPPGSSYASALLAGWLGGTLAGGGKPTASPLREGARWAPVTTADGLALALDGVPLPGSELTGPRLLLDRAMGVVPVPLQAIGSVATLQLTGPAPPPPGRSLLYADDGTGPQPGIDPCLPCRGGGSGGSPGAPETVIVDLSSSGGLPPQMALVAVFLRVGKAAYAFDGSRDPALLAANAAGDLGELVLSGIGGVFRAGEQPSLLLVVNVGGSAYWHEVPIHMPTGSR